MNINEMPSQAESLTDREEALLNPEPPGSRRKVEIEKGLDLVEKLKKGLAQQPDLKPQIHALEQILLRQLEDFHQDTTIKDGNFQPRSRLEQKRSPRPTREDIETIHKIIAEREAIKDESERRPIKTVNDLRWLINWIRSHQMSTVDKVTTAGLSEKLFGGAKKMNRLESYFIGLPDDASVEDVLGKWERGE